ncbi:BMP family ABC transporter substrate-binding protein [Paraburkholderia edwinii]|jgi:simple sugar transport system substrate-binding protein|uniref:BMP family ABC transporter substrate-binding protein n=1 Tax=Paraburkholderia edwinii TaxID=2861782 RepID=A0ABX8UGR3_9BURK|nr:BMP family ABC transporter substrate-binding protein [Paraburkholderia edwinii]QYD68013.1 BMP family ABC transporter substrate-binding protein [Paraburkholderia edwinii]
MKQQINRRQFLALSGAGAVGLATGMMPRLAAAKDKLTIGIVYVGPRDDFGWNQSHALAAQALRSLPNVNVVEEENVPETIAVRKSMESMVQLDGASLILGTSFGYFDPYMVELARAYPDVQFRHASRLWDPAKHPNNLGGYFAYRDQGHYVNGVAAGLSTKTNQIGYVAAKPIGIVLRTINSFMLGVRKVNPHASVKLIFTGDWTLPVREAEATNALIAGGCDVIACHVDSPKVVVETAEQHGVKSCGHNTSQAALAPKGFITGAEAKWDTAYKGYAADIAAGRKLPNALYGGYDKDLVASTPFGAGATPAARNAALAAIADLKAGKPIYVGPIRSNTGKIVIDRTYGNYDPFLDQTNYLVEGVVGSIA